MQTVWIVFRTTDFTAGRGPMVIEGIFSTEKDACTFIRRRPYIMGGFMSDDKESWQVSSYPAFESEQEYVERVKGAELQVERQKALEKLSPRERELLGIKD